MVEGEHDKIFLSHIISKCNPQKNIKFFNIEGETKDKRPDESNAIAKFISPWSNYDILVKTEGGKDKVTSYLSNLWNQISDKDVSLVGIIDYDLRGKNHDFQKLKEKIERKYTGAEVLVEKEENKHNVIHKRIINVYIHGEFTSKFFLIGFLTSLEKTTRALFPTENQDKGIEKLAQKFTLHEFL